MGEIRLRNTRLAIPAVLLAVICLWGCDPTAPKERAKTDNAAGLPGVPSPGGSEADGVVAVIDGDNVTAMELNLFTREMVPGFRGSREEWNGAIDTLINNRLLARKAEKEKVDQLPRIRSKVRMAAAFLWEQPYWNTVVRPTVKVTEEDIRKSAPRFEDLVTIRQMVVSDRKEAEAFREKAVKDPKSLEKLIKERSEGLTAKAGGLVPNITRGMPQYSKETLSMLFASKKGDISPVVETPIGYMFFETVSKTSAGEAERQWRKESAGVVQRRKEEEVWDTHLDNLANRRKIRMHDKTIEAYLKAKEAGEDLTRFAGRPAFSIDNTQFFIVDLVDPSSLGIVHGEQTLPVIMKKKITQYVIDLEAGRAGLKEKFPEVRMSERFRRENVLARAYLDHRSKGLKVTPEMEERYYREHKEKFFRPRSLDISAIETRSPDRIKEIYESLAAGEDFGVLADRWSDNSKRFPKGRIGRIPEEEVAPEFRKVKSLEPGQYLKEPIVLPLKKEEGNLYVVLRLNAVEDKGYIPFEKASRDDIGKAVMAQARENVVKTVMEELRRGNKVEITKGYYRNVDTWIGKNKEPGGNHGKNP